MKSNSVHELKLQQPFYDAVKSGEKTFEIRLNDRGYQKGDTLNLMPWSAENHCYVEPYKPVVKRVTYVLADWGLKEGYVCLGLGEPEDDNEG